LFQSTRPRGARQGGGVDYALGEVSIHAPVWGATKIFFEITGIKSFNPRARVGRDKLVQMIASNQSFQSTRPCGARPFNRIAGLDFCVSIHAPVWGATLLTYSGNVMLSFNPRARVGRDNVAIFDRQADLFQSTRPCGARPEGHAVVCVGCVSIHAPVWGATQLLCGYRPAHRFNPRARVGRDAKSFSHLRRMSFQSTRPCGARLLTEELDMFLAVSIHAPVWGATRKHHGVANDHSFNPRARVGRDTVTAGSS